MSCIGGLIAIVQGTEGNTIGPHSRPWSVGVRFQSIALVGTTGRPSYGDKQSLPGSAVNPGSARALHNKHSLRNQLI